MKQSEYIHISAVTDENYSQHVGVMITSLLINTKYPEKIVIHLVDGGICPESKCKLAKIVDSFKAKILFYNVDEKIYSNLSTSHHITQAAYYRISLPDILDKEIKKVIYLDCDLIIKEDINQLWMHNINKYFLAAVEDIGGKVRLPELKIPSDFAYFNSGVLLLNLEKWRENNSSNEVLDFLKLNHQKLIYHDQDALNAIFYSEWFKLKEAWNFQYNMTLRDQKHRLKKPHIIHYTGSTKPWHFHDTSLFKKEYYYYLKLSPWKGFRPPVTLKGIIKKTVKKTLPTNLILALIKLKP